MFEYRLAEERVSELLAEAKAARLAAEAGRTDGARRRRWSLRRRHG